MQRCRWMGFTKNERLQISDDRGIPLAQVDYFWWLPGSCGLTQGPADCFCRKLEEARANPPPMNVSRHCFGKPEAPIRIRARKEGFTLAPARILNHGG